MFGSNVWATVVGRAARVPVVVAHEHTWDYEGQPLRRLLDRRLIGRFADAFVAVSEADRERMITVEGVPADKVRVMPNAFVPSEGAAPGDLRTELGLGPEAPLVGIACILRPQKAVDVLLDAFALVRTPGAQLVIAGDGDCRESLERQAAALGIAGRTHFLGLRHDVASILAGLDVAAISSDFEGTPLFALETHGRGDAAGGDRCRRAAEPARARAQRAARAATRPRRARGRARPPARRARPSGARSRRPPPSGCARTGSTR